MLQLLRRITPKQYALIAAWILGCVALALVYRQIDVKALHERAAGMNGAAVFAVMTGLPLVGFPASLLHVVMGVRFGIPLGLALVAAAILVQLCVGFLLVKLMPGFFARRLEPLRKRIPSGAHDAAALFALLLPGAPYFSQIYLLPLMGVPFRKYVLWSFPLHFIRSVVSVTFGDLSDNLTPGRLAFFAVYTVLLMSVFAWAFRRLRAKMQDPQPAAGDPTPRA